MNFRLMADETLVHSERKVNERKGRGVFD